MPLEAKFLKVVCNTHDTPILFDVSRNMQC